MGTKEQGRARTSGDVEEERVDRRLITESKEVLRIWAAYYKELLNGKGVEITASSRARLGELWRYDRKKLKQQSTR